MSPSAFVGIIVVIAILVVGGIVLTHKKSGLSSNPSACVNKTLSATSSGACVSDLQNLLNWNLYGIDQPNYMKVDGQYSSTLTKAVSTAQSNDSLPSSGTMNLNTWKDICSGTDTPSWWTKAASNAGCTS
jgi:peptidoglycan hydrolase-like protein with peptidoglycan-binding domain